MNAHEEPEKTTFPEDHPNLSDFVSSKQFTIPTLHIEEADTDSDMDHGKEVPQIAISHFDNTELAITEVDDDEEYSSYMKPTAKTPQCLS